MTRAADLFASVAAVDVIEEQLADILATVDGEWDYTYDAYDNSIEVYRTGYDSDETSTAVDALHKFGFVKVWMHEHGPLRPPARCRCPASVMQ